MFLADFHAALRDGVVLCKLANALKANSVAKINTGNLAFKQMENINNFIEAARNMGVRPADLFQTVDLYEANNMTQVCDVDRCSRGLWVLLVMVKPNTFFF